MEPAIEQREHDRRDHHDRDRLEAAMEPAIEQREHPDACAVTITESPVPQWSPPSNGGSTCLV